MGDMAEREIPQVDGRAAGLEHGGARHREVGRAIRKLNRRKAAGPDEAPVAVYKEMDRNKTGEIERTT